MAESFTHLRKLDENFPNRLFPLSRVLAPGAYFHGCSVVRIVRPRHSSALLHQNIKCTQFMRRKLNSPNLSLAISVLLQHFGITESRPWTHRHVQTQSFYVTLYKSINILLGDLCYPFLRTYTITFTVIKIVSSSFLMPLIQHQHQYSIRGLLSMYVVVQ